MSKIIIIGLPRTGTTSISVSLAMAGYKVAHTAFTKETFFLADAISDAPCFSDYKQLDNLFPNSKFIYLQRELISWLPSMQRLLVKMAAQLNLITGSFSPVLKRSFVETFELTKEHFLPQNLLSEHILSDEHLIKCYKKHQGAVQSYFKDRQDLLTLNLSDVNSFQKMCTFLSLPYTNEQTFPHLNKGAQVAGWKSFKHTNKISSFSAGKDHRQFFDYHKKSITF